MTTTTELAARFTTRAYERDLDGDLNAANAWRVAAAELAELADAPLASRAPEVAELLTAIKRQAGTGAPWGPPFSPAILAELVTQWFDANGYELADQSPDAAEVPAEPVLRIIRDVRIDSRHRWHVLVDGERVATLRWSGEHMLLIGADDFHLGTLYRSDGKITGHEFVGIARTCCVCAETDADGDHPRRIAYTWRAYARFAGRQDEVARGAEQTAAVLAILRAHERVLASDAR